MQEEDIVKFAEQLFVTPNFKIYRDNCAIPGAELALQAIIDLRLLYNYAYDESLQKSFAKMCERLTQDKEALYAVHGLLEYKTHHSADPHGPDVAFQHLLYGQTPGSDRWFESLSQRYKQHPEAIKTIIELKLEHGLVFHKHEEFEQLLKSMESPDFPAVKQYVLQHPEHKGRLHSIPSTFDALVEEAKKNPPDTKLFSESTLPKRLAEVTVESIKK